jgi:hypothetical protein
MWSLGTLFGKTLKVDMRFTREKGVLRILVGCLDFRRIPAKERIFIADGFYDISFEVETQRELVLSMEVTTGEDHSDHDGHGNNDDSTPENQKNLDAMETDVAHNRHELDGSKNAASNGPDINKLVGDFSSGVKFSPRVKLMMEQSKKEIVVFINSLVPAAATAEDQLLVPAASAVVDCVETSAGAGILATAADCLPPVAAAAEAMPPAVSSPPVSPPSANDAGADIPCPVQPAGAQGVPAFAVGAGETAVSPVTVEAPAGSATGAAFSAATSSPSSHAAADMVGPKADGPSFTSPTKDSFRASSESSGTLLFGQKKDASTFIDAKKTAPLSPSARNNGSSSSKPSEAPPAGYEKETPWIAAVPFSPSTPSKPKNIEDIIAFGGISEKLASPMRSSQRVKMQHNGEATEMERATQLAERRFHAISPGTKSNLSFSKFSDFEIEHRATTLGVSLGSSASATKHSIAALKKLEEDRRITYLQNNLNEYLGKESESSIFCTANQLCSDLAIEDSDAPVGDLADSSLNMPIKMFKRRNKKTISAVGVSVRRSTRIKKKSSK